MKIRTQEVAPPQVDITELFLNFKEQYRNVFIFQIDSQVFIYRSLGRNEYKKILTDERFTNEMKEELICQTCTLWPNDYDFEDCDEAGIPTVLMRVIIKNSYLDEDESRRNVLEFYRQEMWDLDNQISCIINEAFPQFDIEEIENWDIDKTTKYLSRAEWKLHNLRGLQFVEPQGDFYEKQDTRLREDSHQQEPVRTEEIQPVKKEKAKEQTIRGGKREKLTPEKIKEMNELKAKFPEINWEADDGFKGIDGLEQESIDVTSPALRPGF